MPRAGHPNTHCSKATGEGGPRQFLILKLLSVPLFRSSPFSPFSKDYVHIRVTESLQSVKPALVNARAWNA
jgi:hypothetical protein